MSDEDSTVTYKMIPGIDPYRFGSDGSVWSRHIRGIRKDFGPWRRLNPATHDMGHGLKYYAVTLAVDGTYRRKRVHRVIAEAFLGPCPDGMEVCHNDGNGLNCRIENLRYDTRKGNMADQLIHGTRNRGTRNGQAKIRPDDVCAIRSRAARGESFQSIANDYPVCRSQVRRIVERKKWGSVT